MGFKNDATSVQITRDLLFIFQKTIKKHQKEEANLNSTRVKFAAIIKEINLNANPVLDKS